MKTIVTHLSVDLDAITAIWLIKKLLPGWKNAATKFVPAGTTLNDKNPDENPEIIHVDTGLGKFDHHQSNKFISASQLVYEFLLQKNHISEKNLQPLERIVNYVTEIDFFHEVFFPNPSADYHEFSLYQIVYGLRATLNNDAEIVNYSFPLLDSVLQVFKNKISAESEIKKGYVFQTKYGKSLVLETKNHETIKLALKSGFDFAATKDSSSGNIRIKTLPRKRLDLTPLYKRIILLDKKGSWFLHASKNMLLNGSSKNPKLIPSKLTLIKLIEIIKSV